MENEGGGAENRSKGRRTTMPQIAWQKEVDAALEEARASGRPVLIDFSAAPA